MKLSDYLEQIQNHDESIFPMDSIAQRRTFTDKERERRKKKEKIVEQKETKKRVMVDLDGTIHKYSKGFQDGTLYDGPFDGAKEAIDWLRDQGYEVVIFTTRVSEENSEEMGNNLEEQYRYIEEYLRKNGIYFDRITAEKLAAEFYVDDRAVHIPNGDWDYVISTISKRISRTE
jgi:hypothetical protein